MSTYIRYPAEGGGSGTVSSINGATGPAISILPGTGIDVTTVGNNITITNTGSNPTGTPNTIAGFDGAGDLESIPHFNIKTDSGGFDIAIPLEPNGTTDGLVANNLSMDLNPLQDSPDETHEVLTVVTNADTNNSGFNSGNIQNLNLQINAGNTGDVSSTTQINMYNSIGNGTDPISVGGIGYVLAFGDFNENVTLNNAIQGFVFQPHIHTNVTFDTDFNSTAYADYINIESPTNSHTSFQASPNIVEINNNHNYAAININPTITTMTGNAGYNAVSVFGQIDTMSATGSLSGYQFSPNITTSHGNISGLNVSPNVVGGDASFSGININPSGAATLTNVRGLVINLGNIGTTDVQGPISIETDSRISINAGLTLHSAQGFQIGNRMESLMQISNGSPVTGTDVLGNNLAGDLLAQDDMAVGPIGLGFNSVGFIASMAVAATKTVDKITVFLPAASFPDPGFTTGGDITDMTFIKIYSPLAQGGTANISTLYGLKIDSLFGDFSSAASTVWGIYSDDLLLQHKLAGQLDLGNLELQGSTSGEVGIRAAATTTDYQLTLPPAVGSNGDVLTTNSSGVLSWAPAGSGANVFLSNLDPATAINSSLLPDTDAAYNLGDAAHNWSTLSVLYLDDAANNHVMDVQSRLLKDSTSTTALDFGGPNIAINTRKITGVVNPTSAQDVATKNYVDTNAGANVTLSNLGTTAINASLVPNVTNAISLGSTTKSFGTVWSREITSDNTVTVHSLDSNATNTRLVTVKSGDGGTSINSGNVDITSGTAGGTSGNVTISTGTSTGTRGSVTITANNINLNAVTQISANSKKIVSMADPTSAQDAATKAYVDAQVGNPFKFYASSQVTTDSSAVTTNTFTTVDNSPALSFTPTVTGTYKVYSSVPLQCDSGSDPVAGRIILTSGSGTLLQESQGSIATTLVGTLPTGGSVLIQSVYTLTASVAYVFDIQIRLVAAAGGQQAKVTGTYSPFYMFAERCG